MFKYTYDFPKFLLMCFIFLMSIYDLFIEGSFYTATTTSKIRNAILLVIILVVIIKQFTFFS